MARKASITTAASSSSETFPDSSHSLRGSREGRRARKNEPNAHSGGHEGADGPLSFPTAEHRWGDLRRCVQRVTPLRRVRPRVHNVDGFATTGSWLTARFRRGSTRTPPTEDVTVRELDNCRASLAAERRLANRTINKHLVILHRTFSGPSESGSCQRAQLRPSRGSRSATPAGSTSCRRPRWECSLGLPRPSSTARCSRPPRSPASAGRAEGASVAGSRQRQALGPRSPGLHASDAWRHEISPRT